MTNDERYEVVYGFIEQFGVEAEWLDSGESGAMYVEYSPPFIKIPACVTQFDYMVCLHELGHVVHKHTCGRPGHESQRFYYDNGVLRSEAQAWNWAMDVCDEELEPNTAMQIWELALGTYYNHYVSSAGLPTRLYNAGRHHVEFIYDEPDEYFQHTRDRIQALVNTDATTARVLTIELDNTSTRTALWNSLRSSFTVHDGITFDSSSAGAPDD